jgi:hypothetical protein
MRFIKETDLDRIGCRSPERKVGSPFRWVVSKNVGIGRLHLAIQASFERTIASSRPGKTRLEGEVTDQ